MRNRRAQKFPEEICRLDALLSVMAELDDTWVLYRGGVEALDAVKSGAKAVLVAGGYGSENGRQHMRKLDRELIRRHLSPGGSDDLLAATIFLDTVERGQIRGARIYLGMQTAGDDFASFVWASQAESQFKLRARFLPVLHCRKQSRRPFEDEDLSSSGRSSYICMDASCRNRERSLRKLLRTENSVKKGSAEISDCGFRLQPVGDHSLLRPRRVAAPCAPRTIGPNPARRIVDRGSVRLFVSRCQLTPSPGALRQNKETSTFLCES
jgi:hypothetical protein